MAAPQLRPYAFKPGQSGNPSGRPVLPPELAAIRSLTQPEICKLVSKIGRMSREELQAATQDNKLPMIEVTIISIFAQAAKNGDPNRLAFLLDRAIGKVPVAALDDESEARASLRAMTTEELVKKAEELLPALRKPA